MLLASLQTIAQIQLEGLYATSTSLPLSEFAVENVFDGDRNTVWKTPQGAGPNEGIMIYFSEPTYVSKVSAEFLVETGLSRVISMEVYGDGRSFWTGQNINQELSFLYIKIARAQESQRIESTIDGKQYSRNKFSSTTSVAIKELSLFDQQGLTYKINPPKLVKGSINSTSNLKPKLAYGAANLMDSRKDLGWAENKPGNGIGEEISFSLSEPIKISKLKIWNGYQRSPTHFSGNARLKLFEFGVKGTELSQYSIEDITAGQFIDLASIIEGREFILRVIDAYPGDKYKDLVISEIKFFHEDIPIVIKTNAEENRMIAMRKKSPLTQSFLDHSFQVSMSQKIERETGKEYYSEYMWESKSLSLRSNNTFVLYIRESLSIEEYNGDTNYENYENDSKEVIADGNWELKEEAGDYIKIRIFGKIYSPTSMAELYQGDVSSDNVRIFQDYLTLRKDKISGQRFVGDIILKD